MGFETISFSVAVRLTRPGPESWLLVHNRPEQAKRALERIRGNSLAPEYLQEEFVEMARGIDEEKELASSSSVLDIFKGTDRRRTIICLGTILSHAGAGLWLIIGYGVCSMSTFCGQVYGPLPNTLSISICLRGNLQG